MLSKGHLTVRQVMKQLGLSRMPGGANSYPEKRALGSKTEPERADPRDLEEFIKTRTNK